MSKKLFITIITVVIFILIFIGWRIFLTPAATPTPDTAASAPGNNLFPFGQGAVGSKQPASATSTGGQSSNQIIDLSNGTGVAQLRRLSTDPSVGGAFAQVGTTSEAVRFVDRATGHIFESAVDSSAQSELSNVTIPQIREALWDAKGGNLIYRYLKSDSTLQSFYASIKANMGPASASSSPAIEGIFLPANISSLALTGGKILYFDPTSENGNLILANADGSKKTLVWSSDFGDWMISSNNPAKAFVYTRASASANGVGYIIDTAKGTATKVIGDVVGLEGTINPAGTYVFMSASQNGGIASASYSAAKKTVSTLSLSTLASKCAWSNVDPAIIYCGVPANIPSGAYPDDWYKGSTSFSDRLWKINMATGETTVLLDPFIDTTTNYDMTNLVVDPTDSYLTFVNKNDLTIWLYQIK